MFVIATLIVTCMACWIARKQIASHETAFYAVAIAIDVAYIAMATGAVAVPFAVWRIVFELMQECTLAFALFAIVMYIGVFSKKSYIGVRMRAIRGQLSIAALFLSLGHCAVYLGEYIPRIFGAGTVRSNVVVAFTISIVALALLLLLGITSFKCVRKHMNPQRWKAIQKLSYVFFALIYVHVVTMFAPSAMAGGIAAMHSLAVYTVVFGFYAIGRITRWQIDAKEAQ